MAYLGFLSCAILILVDVIAAVTFNYDRNDRRAGPYGWGPLGGQCNGFRQSPININTNLVSYGRSYALEYIFMNPTIGGTFKISHDHFPTFKVDTGYKLTGVPHHEADVFELAQFHFHYGPSDLEGSEHFVDGRPYPGEVHLVHFNAKYGTYDNAVNYPDGRVVVAIFLQSGARSSRPSIDTFLWQHIPLIRAQDSGRQTRRTGRNSQRRGGNTGRSVRTSLAPIELLPDSSDMYTYAGSTTTPPCRENVRWIIHKEPITLTKATMQLLRTVQQSGLLPSQQYGNFRPVQRLNGRRLEANFVQWPQLTDDLLTLYL